MLKSICPCGTDKGLGPGLTLRQWDLQCLGNTVALCTSIFPPIVFASWHSLVPADVKFRSSKSKGSWHKRKMESNPCSFPPSLSSIMGRLRSRFPLTSLQRKRARGTNWWHGEVSQQSLEDKQRNSSWQGKTAPSCVKAALVMCSDITSDTP